MMKNNYPSAFVSYSWDDDNHRAWVKDLCTRLRFDGIDVTLDQWNVHPGDQLTAFMERGIRESKFVIIVCTPRYKEKADARSGGVGYEENIITAEVAATQNERKFIPVLAKGKWHEAAPNWVIGKSYIDLSGKDIPQPLYDDLLITLRSRREAPPPLGQPHSSSSPQHPIAGLQMVTPPATSKRDELSASKTDGIRIVELIASEVTSPRNDGTSGSSLYAVPFLLSKVPSSIWEKAFLYMWDHPTSFTTMHRPGIARIHGDRIILDGTTVEEVDKYHRDTLLLTVAYANDIESKIVEERQIQEAHRKASSDQHRKVVENAAKRIKF
jgi:hypothetical protein